MRGKILRSAPIGEGVGICQCRLKLDPLGTDGAMRANAGPEAIHDMLADRVQPMGLRPGHHRLAAPNLSQ